MFFIVEYIFRMKFENTILLLMFDLLMFGSKYPPYSEQSEIQFSYCLIYSGVVLDTLHTLGKVKYNPFND